MKTLKDYQVTKILFSTFPFFSTPFFFFLNVIEKRFLDEQDIRVEQRRGEL